MKVLQQFFWESLLIKFLKFQRGINLASRCRNQFS